ncbi:hypothetical protein CSQ85_08805 [Bifidobacterium rousetti]|uniref:hypothetical protein n=1 Tax=Bifidobacterium rousetti TaxID=2045439 RepID=UPI00123B023B|nr:hypothetical protein [Bifidobacterium rousetti]KAA8818250.1 hypothetical protein CSQ85_08805 [Bifidobacterium rousetti]
MIPTTLTCYDYSPISLWPTATIEGTFILEPAPEWGGYRAWIMDSIGTRWPVSVLPPFKPGAESANLVIPTIYIEINDLLQHHIDFHVTMLHVEPGFDFRSRKTGGYGLTYYRVDDKAFEEYLATAEAADPRF